MHDLPGVIGVYRYTKG